MRRMLGVEDRQLHYARVLALEFSALAFFGLFWGCFAVLLAALGVIGIASLAIFILSLRL